MAGPALGHWPGCHHSELLAIPHGRRGKDGTREGFAERSGELRGGFKELAGCPGGGGAPDQHLAARRPTALPPGGKGSPTISSQPA